MTGDAAFDGWVEALWARHRDTLTFSEIRKGVVALSRIYVGERHRLGGDVFAGAGKRAAFACFYSPLHYLLTRHIVEELGAHEPPPSQIVDLGCGLLPAGAAWARAAGGGASILGVDQSPWVVGEARAVVEELGVRARVLRRKINLAPMPKPGDALVAAFSINELSDVARERLLGRLARSSRRGASVLVIEPIARRPTPWWEPWRDTFLAARGRADEWRFPVELPRILAELDRASGLDHRELSGRSLFLRGFS